MKKFLPNPHTLLVCFILIIISSGSSLKAQDDKQIKRTIIINNGDTIINGKKLSEVSKEERARLREDFKDAAKRIKETRTFSRGGKGEKKEIIIKRGEPLLWNEDNKQEFGFRMEDRFPGSIQVFRFNGDSLMLTMRGDSLLKGFPLDSNLRKRLITMHRDIELAGPGMRLRAMPGAIPRGMPRAFMERSEFPSMHRNNSSSFNYTYTDKDGISSRMNISISDAEKEKLKKITGSETITNALEVNDITIFPNFSSGKPGLSFNLASRGTTRVKILDSDLKEVYSDEAAGFSGNYVKQVPLSKNGIYYISISQNGRWFIKKVIKN